MHSRRPCRPPPDLGAACHLTLGRRSFELFAVIVRHEPRRHRLLPGGVAFTASRRGRCNPSFEQGATLGPGSPARIRAARVGARQPEGAGQSPAVRRTTLRRPRPPQRHRAARAPARRPSGRSRTRPSAVRRRRPRGTPRPSPFLATGVRERGVAPTGAAEGSPCSGVVSRAVWRPSRASERGSR
jgi:hypothetical protein